MLLVHIIYKRLEVLFRWKKNKNIINISLVYYRFKVDWTIIQPLQLDSNPFDSSWPAWLNGWVFVYELSGCGFESSCSHFTFRFRACFEQGVPWHSDNYRVWIHSETRTWHDNNIQYPTILFHNGIEMYLQGWDPKENPLPLCQPVYKEWNPK